MPDCLHWANEFSEIPSTLDVRPDLRSRCLSTLPQSMPGKALEGGERADEFRSILSRVIEGILPFRMRFVSQSCFSLGMLPRISITTACSRMDGENDWSGPG